MNESESIAGKSHKIHPLLFLHLGFLLVGFMGSLAIASGERSFHAQELSGTHTLLPWIIGGPMMITAAYNMGVKKAKTQIAEQVAAGNDR